MVMVLTGHRCNEVCRKLGLTNPYSSYRPTATFEGHKRRARLYIFQLNKIDIIHVKLIIAIRKPVPDPIKKVIVPVVPVNDNVQAQKLVFPVKEKQPIVEANFHKLVCLLSEDKIPELPRDYHIMFYRDTGF